MSSLINAEILQIAESVAKEKGISREIIISSMEHAIEAAGKRKYGQEHDIRAEISRKSGEISLIKVLTVVQVVEDPNTQISLKDANDINPSLKINDIIKEQLPPIDLGRLAAQSAKQVIVHQVREAERDKQYEDFKGRIAEILSGTVKRIDNGNIIVDLGRVEAIIKRDQLIRGENFRMNDRIKAYVVDVRREKKGPQIFMSRTANGFLAKLLEIEVPEIYDKIVTIKAIAREPGSKAKVAVYSSDFSVDAVGTCVGPRGSRVRVVTEELSGEKIDLINWSEDLVQMTINSLAPAEISKVVIDNDKHKIEAVVSEENLNLAIGRRGQNIRLAAKLINWNMSIISEKDESKRRSEAFNDSVSSLVESLELDETMAQLLTVEGYVSVEHIASAELEALSNIEGFDMELAVQLQERAQEFIDRKNEEMLLKLEELGVEQELLDTLCELDISSILAFAEAGIKTIEDLGEINLDEFKSLDKYSRFSNKEIESLIRNAKEAGENE